jgi:hypothetical protein
MPQFDARLASMHKAIQDDADFIMALRKERDEAKLAALSKDEAIKRLREANNAFRAENEQMKQMLQWINTGNNEDAA